MPPHAGEMDAPTSLDDHGHARGTNTQLRIASRGAPVTRLIGAAPARFRRIGCAQDHSRQVRGSILPGVDGLFLDGAAVTRLIDPPELLDVLADGFRLLSAGAVVAPKRIEVA